MMFGRKQPSGKEPSNLRANLDLTSEDDIQWVKQSGDPLIWHSVAFSTLLFAGASEFLNWLVEEEKLDRTTALMMFLLKDHGKNYLTGGVRAPEDLPEPYGTQQRIINHMIERLCELDGQRQWLEHGIGLEEGWDQVRVEQISQFSDDPRFPRNLFAKPISPQTVKMPYTDIGEGDLVTQSWLRENMPFMAD